MKIATWTKFKDENPPVGDIVVCRDKDGNEYLCEIMVTNNFIRLGLRCTEWRNSFERDIDRLLNKESITWGKLTPEAVQNEIN